MEKDWLDKKETFEVRDVRELKGNFLPSILKRAQDLEVGRGLCIVQSFEPIPLYSALEDLGYEYDTEKVNETEYKVCFYRSEIKGSDKMDVPLKPTAMVNFNTVTPKLAHIAVDFWNLVWGQEDTAIDMKTRLLLSLANGVGAGRIRQATRELVKAYSVGVTARELDELFAMFAWNQGIGNFASEIGSSSLFAAYQFIKTQEQKNTKRSEIAKELIERFGEKNPDVSTFYKGVKNK